VTQPSASGPTSGGTRRVVPFRSTIRGEEVTTGDTGAEARGEPTDGGAAAAIAPRRTSLKDGGEGPPPDFPNGGVSWLLFIFLMLLFIRFHCLILNICI